jgi:hypothetical protein
VVQHKAALGRRHTGEQECGLCVPDETVSSSFFFLCAGRASHASGG